MKISVSIVITVYNRENYLAAAIKSVLAQTWSDLELLIWDDGSTDRSVEIASEYAQQDQRIRVIAAKHTGIAPAIHGAVAATTGDYIGWVDSDDILAPTALEQTISILNNHPKVGLVYTDYQLMDEQGNLHGIGQRCQIPYSKERLLVDFMIFHTSLDGAVALISSSGNVNAQGAIASVDNVTLGATKDVLAQNIVSALGTVALVSSKGSVTDNGNINSAGNVAIQANQNVTTGKIYSQWDKVALIAKEGTVTTQGDITTNNGDVYISSVGNVISQNIISNGGVIAIASSQGAVTTGYLRSDGNHTGGKIYVQADGSVRVTGSVHINNANYSIYTGIKKKGLISIAYESGVLKSNKSKFVIGDAKSNGTAAGIYGPYAFKDEDIIPNLIAAIQENVN